MLSMGRSLKSRPKGSSISRLKGEMHPGDREVIIMGVEQTAGGALHHGGIMKQAAVERRMG